MTQAGPDARVPLPAREPVADPLAAAEAVRAALSTRRSIRDFDPVRAVPPAVIESVVATAGSAPSGANRQPWHFVAIADPDLKARIRAAAEAEERAFYAGGGGAEWLGALAPLGTDADKPHLTDAPWLIVVFAERRGADGGKNYYVPESTGIALGFLIAAIHMAGLACLPHTPAPMGFLTEVCGRPAWEKPIAILPVGYPAAGATVPAHAVGRKPLPDILTVVA